jgi:TolB-like protein/Tfp pilus assembly protein PilF
LGEAYATLGLVLQHRGKWAESEKLKKRAIKLNPNYVHAHEWWAAQLVGLGRADEGAEEMRRAESLDPLSLRTKTLTAWTLYQAHHFEDALERAEQIIDLDKNYPQGYSQAGFALWAMGRHAEALPHFQKFDRMIPNFALAKYQLCFGLAAVARHEEARRVLDEIKTLAASSYVKPYFLAMAHVAVGELDRAFEYFEQSFEENEPWLLWFGTDPMLESLHGDWRFVDLLERMNNPIAERFKKRRSKSNKTPAFAVLPFRLLQFNTGESSENEFLSIGLTDALITRLSKINRVIVRPTSAVMRFGDISDALRAGKQLEADFVLAGNIRLVGNRVRVSAQLLKVADKSTTWAETFDEKFTDVLELEDSISERVAKSLLPQLTGKEQKQLHKRETDSPEAYEAYLKGRFYWNLMTEEGFAKAIRFYERAVALDPNYALAYAAIAEYYIFLAVHCVIPFADASRIAKDAAERAASLDPLLAEAQNALGIVAINHDFDWDAAEKYVIRALELNPNSFAANQWAKTLYLQTGRFDLAFRYASRLFEIAPDSTMSVHFMAWTQHCSRRFDAALESYNRLIAAEPLYAHARMSFSWTLRAVGKYAEAVEQARKATEIAAENLLYRCTLAAALADDNQTEAARAALFEIDQTAKVRYVSPYMLALVHCALGDRDRAFSELERAFAIRDVWVVFAAVEPLFDFLRGDRRFDDLLRRMNHPLAPRKKVVEIEKTIDVSPVEKPEKSIAVLPLTILGANTGNADDEYLGVGLADAMITRLSSVRRLVVRPTSSILRFGNCADSFAAGRELTVDFVLCGTIRRAGTRLRITTQLLDVAKNSIVWAGKFDEEFTDVLALEDLVAEKVGRLLISQLTGQERHQLAKRGTNKPAAYEAYLRGRFQWNQFTPDSLLKSIEFFKQAIDLEPEYALAFASMADCHYWLGAFGVGTPREHFEAARAGAKRAIEYDQTLGEAYSVLGFVSLFSAVPFIWREAEDLCRRGIELNPNYAWGHIWYSAFLASAGRFDESISESRRALELDPLSPINQQHLGFVLYHARRFDESAAQYEKAIADHPDFGFVRGTYGWMLRAAGRLEESLAQTRRAVELNPGTSLALCGLAATLFKLGETGEALELVQQIETVARERHFSPFHLAVMYANIGDTDRAFEQFEAAITDNDAWVIWLSVDPQLDVLRDDARYQNWLRRTGNPLVR